MARSGPRRHGAAVAEEEGGVSVRVLCGDAIEVLAGMEAESFSAIVTDPPAGISFMNRAWDGDKGGRDAWIAWMQGIAAECLRVCKPGAHALVWSLPRTSHWTAMAWENAGWTVRDRVSHLFASGFPKSLDVSKAIDRKRQDDAQWKAVGTWLRQQREARGLKQKQVAALWPSETGGLTGCVANWELGFNGPKWDQWQRLKEFIGFSEEMDAEVWRLNGRKGQPGEAWFEREVLSAGISGQTAIWSPNGGMGEFDITAPATEAARQWQGWGTALKPACEDWWLLRKPLSENTVAAQVLKTGTGALNIDSCRVAIADDDPHIARGSWSADHGTDHARPGYDGGFTTGGRRAPNGRWPAQICHDGSPEVMEAFARFGERLGDISNGSLGNRPPGYGMGPQEQRPGPGDTGTAARFFFSAKAAAWEREGSHPTVKPGALMEWLVKLVTPPGGTVLDPFCGTGSTLVACDWLGIDAVGIEQDPQTCRDAEAKIKRLRARRMLGDAPRNDPLPGQLGLF